VRDARAESVGAPGRDDLSQCIRAECPEPSHGVVAGAHGAQARSWQHPGDGSDPCEDGINRTHLGLSCRRGEDLVQKTPDPDEIGERTATGGSEVRGQIRPGIPARQVGDEVNGQAIDGVGEQVVRVDQRNA
jgi:hypothetical protein